jgi:hypothetical protein
MLARALDRHRSALEPALEGQASTSSSTRSSTVTPASSTSTDMVLGPKMGATINHVARAFVEHAAPVVQSDRQLQQTVGAAAGRAAAERLATPVTVAAWALAGAAGVAIYKMLA